MEQVIFSFVAYISKNYKEIVPGEWYTDGKSSDDKTIHISDIYKKYISEIEFKFKN